MGSHQVKDRTGGPPARVVRDACAIAVAVLVGSLHAVVSLTLFQNMRSGMDLAIFDQAVRALSKFQLPISAMKAPGMNLWGDHFHPVLVLAAPFYWLWDDPRTLLLVQAGAIGLTSAMIVREAAERLDGRWSVLTGACIAVGFAASPGVQFAAVFDFHEVVLGLPILALACRSLLRHEMRAFLIWSLALLPVKEDMGPLVAGLAIVAFLEGHRRIATAVGLIAVLWTGLVVKVIIPAISPSGQWLYSSALPEPSAQFHNLWRAIVEPEALGESMAVLLVAGVFLALRSRLVLALLPVLLMRAVTGNES